MTPTTKQQQHRQLKGDGGSSLPLIYEEETNQLFATEMSPCRNKFSFFFFYPPSVNVQTNIQQLVKHKSKGQNTKKEREEKLFCPFNIFLLEDFPRVEMHLNLTNQFWETIN